MKNIVWLILIFLISGNASFAQSQSSKVKVIKLEAYKRIDEPAREEVSGIVKSRKYEDTFWVHGDSGTKDRIYAINAEGEIKSEDKNYKGTELKGAKNFDWEDIAIGFDGTLIVADIGNNCLCRDDLKLFIINEPSLEADEVEVISEYKVEYPKEGGITNLLFDRGYNSEAVFVKDRSIYVITKSESGKTGTLFQLDSPSTDKVNMFKEITEFPFRGKVTAADISADEKMLAVLTYKSIWLFELTDKKKFFKGNIFWQPIKGVQQVESITFSGENLIIAEENGDLYRIKIDEIPAYKKN